MEANGTEGKAMRDYLVSGYLVTNVYVYVKAESEEDALELGSELLIDGKGVYGDEAWQSEFDVVEEVTE